MRAKKFNNQLRKTSVADAWSSKKKKKKTEEPGGGGGGGGNVHPHLYVRC